MGFKTPLAQSSVGSNDPPFSFNNIGLFDSNTSNGHYNMVAYSSSTSACFVHNCFNFCHQVISRQIWLTFLFENSFFFLVFLNFEFPIVDGCSKKSILWITFIETFECSFGSMNQGICFKLCFDLFWDVGDAVFFLLGSIFLFHFQRLTILIATHHQEHLQQELEYPLLPNS